jgi:hypothetical protein
MTQLIFVSKIGFLRKKCHVCVKKVTFMRKKCLLGKRAFIGGGKGVYHGEKSVFQVKIVIFI